MNKILLSAVLATSLVSSAFAVVPTSDLILGFRDDGSAGGTNTTQNLQIDLGAISTFKNQAQGTTTVVTNLLSLGANSISTVFTGTTWTDNTGLFWGIAGTSGTLTTQRTLWGSNAANGSSLNGFSTSVAFNNANAAGQSTGASKIATMYTNQASSVQVKGTADLGAWSAQELGAAVAFGAAPFGDLTFFENNTAVGAGFHASDLYEFVPSSTASPGKYLGTFAIMANGDVSFTAAAVPEPSTYAAIAGAAVLGFVALRRRRQMVAV